MSTVLYLEITEIKGPMPAEFGNKEIIQISKSKPKKISILCTFNVYLCYLADTVVERQGLDTELFHAL
jgi:hypothetical protein